jgi:hypothetical protein
MIPHCNDRVTESGEDGSFHPIPHIQVETVDSIPVNIYRIWKIPPVWALAIGPQVHMNLIIRRPLKGNDDCLVVVYENSLAALIDASVDINGR